MVINVHDKILMIIFMGIARLPLAHENYSKWILKTLHENYNSKISVIFVE